MDNGLGVGNPVTLSQTAMQHSLMPMTTKSTLSAEDPAIPKYKCH